MSDSANTFAALIEPVARRLLGDPNRKLSTKTEWRYGGRGSLSVDLEKGTFFDHEVGQGGGVLDLIERETGKTGEARVEWLSDEGLMSNGDGRRGNRIVQTYVYTDENGETLFEVVRFALKDFRQRRPDPARPSGWIRSTKGVRQVPYRLPDLLEPLSLGRVVFVVEGEKDVDRLMAIGVPATTNAGGAGKWPSELTEFFAGPDVVVIPDHDPQTIHPKTGVPMFHQNGRPILPGQDHAQAVAQALSGVARVRLLDLSAIWPDMPLKGDVSDWLDRGGGSAEALYDLIERLPAWSPVDPGPSPPSEPYDRENAPPIGEAIEAKLYPIERWEEISFNLNEPSLIDGVLPKQGVGLVFGAYRPSSHSSRCTWRCALRKGSRGAAGRLRSGLSCTSPRRALTDEVSARRVTSSQSAFPIAASTCS